MDFNSRDEVWKTINSAYETIRNSDEFEKIVPQKKGVVVTTKIKDLELEYTERIGFGKWELFEGKGNDTDVTLEMNADVHYGMQMGEINPMQAVVKKQLTIHGVPFKLLRGQKINDKFKDVYKMKVECVENN